MIEKVKAFAFTLAGIGVLLLGLSAYLDRYEIVAAGAGGGGGSNEYTEVETVTRAFRLDKRTGEMCLFPASGGLYCSVEKAK